MTALREQTAAPAPVSRAALRAAGPALLAYAGVRALGLLVLAVWAAGAGRSPHRVLAQRWDSVWYARIAEDGYGYRIALPNGDVHADLAFFPLFPALERAVAAVTPLSVHDAGLLIGWTASLLAAWGIHAVAMLVTGRRAVAFTLVALWGAYPTAFVQSMAYTEALFTALAAWALYAALTGRWVAAGALAAAAGLTRPSGAAVVAAVWVAVGNAHGPALWRERRAPPWRALLGAGLAPLGWLGYVAWVGLHEGSPLGYFEVQAGWGNGFDGGVALLGFVWRNLTGGPASALGGLGLVAALALVAWLLWLGVRQRQPWPLLAYTAVMVATSLAGSGYFGSRPRLMMPAFGLLLPAALALARLPRPRRALVLAAAAAASGAYGAFTLLGPGPP
ncbi:hypothetical protein [Streptomyces hoynatensis]|uniref:Glycosyltransferase RgtA/B/C/D-like domain-containing protein n=1 Tax=Streptomyces hoynatensis TaxID=1141874 RepID=A0A3A9YUX1_9ACTN|nr:hypothetical protein [Streptomyces hoynatensis]RKN39832.1 hypothetical protein D7294_20645 [Streptomyces hoynatensis]